jgi:outer membrane immunogenic protein
LKDFSMVQRSLILSAALLALAPMTATAGGTSNPNVEAAPAMMAAPATPNGNWTGVYAGLQYGQSDLTASALGFSVNAGDFDNFGAHLGYMHDLGQFVIGGELALDRLSADGDNADMVRLRARAGYDLGKFLPYITIGAVQISGQGESETGLNYGIGGEYLVTDRFGLGLEYSKSKFNDVLRGSYHF